MNWNWLTVIIKQKITFQISLDWLLLRVVFIEISSKLLFVCLFSYRNNKFAADDTTSRDSDSLIQEYINVPPTDLYTHCWNHPKIRENWRTVLAAVTLLIIGIILVTMGIFSIANPANSSRGFVFLLAGKGISVQKFNHIGASIRITN